MKREAMKKKVNCCSHKKDLKITQVLWLFQAKAPRKRCFGGEETNATEVKIILALV